MGLFNFLKSAVKETVLFLGLIEERSLYLFHKNNVSSNQGKRDYENIQELITHLHDVFLTTYHLAMTLKSKNGATIQVFHPQIDRQGTLNNICQMTEAIV